MSGTRSRRLAFYFNTQNVFLPSETNSGLNLSPGAHFLCHSCLLVQLLDLRLWIWDQQHTFFRRDRLQNKFSIVMIVFSFLLLIKNIKFCFIRIGLPFLLPSKDFKLFLSPIRLQALPFANRKLKISSFHFSDTSSFCRSDVKLVLFGSLFHRIFDVWLRNPD